MRVAVISTEPVDYTIAFVGGLAASADVHAFLPKQRYAALAGAISNDATLTLHLLDWPRTRSLRNIAFLLELTRRLQASQPDVVHLLSNTQLWLNFAAPLWRWPLVTTVHDVVPHPGDRETAQLPAWSARLMARQSQHLVVHGEGLRKVAVDTFRKTPDRVHVLAHPAMPRYAALAAETPPRRKRPEGGFTVLLFGRIFAYKGLQTLLRAEALIGARVPDLRIVIAGRGDDPSAFASLMGDRSRYDIRHGFIEDLEVAHLFREADVVVLPYREASQSGVLHVASTFGKPVVVTDVGELGATVRPLGTGLVVPPDDPAALAQALLSLARSPQTRREMGGRALAWAEGPNAPSTIGRAAASLYTRIAAGAEAVPVRRRKA